MGFESLHRRSYNLAGQPVQSSVTLTGMFRWKLLCFSLSLVLSQGTGKRLAPSGGMCFWQRYFLCAGF